MIRKSRNYIRKKTLEQSDVRPPSQGGQVAIAKSASIGESADSSQLYMKRIMQLKNKYLVANGGRTYVKCARSQEVSDMNIFYFDRLCNQSERLKLRLEKSLDKHTNSSPVNALLNHHKSIACKTDRVGRLGYTVLNPEQVNLNGVKRSRSIQVSEYDVPLKVQDTNIQRRKKLQKEHRDSCSRESIKDSLKREVLENMEALKNNLLDMIDRRFGMQT